MYTTIRIKRFVDFLVEANYGALEKDDRLKFIANTLIENMEHEIYHEPINEYSFVGIKTFSLATKYKADTLKELTIKWVIDTDEEDERRHFSDKAYVTIVSDTNFVITFHVIKIEDQPDKVFRRELLNYIKEEIYIDMLHEIKHVLDRFDSLFIDYTKNYTRPDKSVTKYFSQDKELNNFLISIITDLAIIKKNTPSITYNAAIKLSDRYQEIIPNIRKAIRNKFLGKLAYYWYKHYELGDGGI